MTERPHRYRRVDSVLWRSAGDGMVALADRDRECLYLSNSARALWLALDRPQTTPQVAAVLARAYGLSPEQIAEDVDRGLAALEHDRLVLRDDPDEA